MTIDRPLLLFVAIAAAAAELGHRLVLPIGAHAYPIVWAPLGALGAALLITDRARWPFYLALSSAITLVSAVTLHDRGISSAIVRTSIDCGQAVLLAWLARRPLHKPFTLERLGHVWVMILTGAAVAAAGALLDASLPTPASDTPWLEAWRVFTMSDALGVLLVAPFTIALLQGPTLLADDSGPWQRIEGVLAIATVAVTIQVVFGDLVPLVVRVPAYVLPALLWASFRCRAGDSAIAVAAACSIAAWHTVAGRGPFTLIDAGTTMDLSLLRAQGASITTSLSLLLLSAVVAERRRAVLEKSHLVAELQQALAEIKTLQGLIPICAWCHKIRDDVGLWERAESYLQRHTDATFSHGICPECVARFEHEEQTAVANESDPA